MNEDEIWRVIDTQRLRIADLLEQLTDDEWRQPSLCAGWTVRDVTAHLAMQPIDLRTSLRGIVAARGRVTRATHDSACARATAPTAELIDAIRRTVGTRTTNTGVTHREQLIDILVHGLDIAVPLGKPLAVTAEAAAVAASRMWSRFPTFGWPFFAQRRLAGLRLTATDTDWSVGEGADLRGPMAALMLLVAGREVPSGMTNGTLVR